MFLVYPEFQFPQFLVTKVRVSVQKTKDHSGGVSQLLVVQNTCKDGCFNEREGQKGLLSFIYNDLLHLQTK